MGCKDHSKLILIIDAEEDHAHALAYRLSTEGYKTRVALDCQSGMAMALQEPMPDLIILDMALPSQGGQEVLRTICNHGKTRNTSLLILTSLSAEADRIFAFEMGCDDYVVKPYSYRELMCRIRALLRRIASVSVEVETVSLNCGDLRLDMAERQVWVGNSSVDITHVEKSLLEILLLKCGQVQSRESLFSQIWGSEKKVNMRVIDVTVKRLREKLGDARDCIETVRGHGYRFRCEISRT